MISFIGAIVMLISCYIIADVANVSVGPLMIASLVSIVVTSLTTGWQFAKMQKAAEDRKIAVAEAKRKSDLEIMFGGKK